MNPLLFGLGLAVLAAAIVDLLWTTLWVNGGGGPITARLMAGVWHGLRAVAGGRSRLLSVSGPLLVMVTFLTWVGLVVAGWSLIFASADAALVDTQGQSGVSWFDLVYYVSYSVFTLGIGDVVPSEGVWQVATILTTASGMLVVTMSVSYLISILGAVSRKRAFASSVTAIGTSSEAFVRNAWDGESFDGFELLLNSLASEVDYLAYQYKAYPILHYYHTGDDEHASAVGIALLDEGLTLIRCGVRAEARPNEALLRTAASSTENYIETRSQAFISPADSPPPPPDLDYLRDAGIPTVSDEEFAETLADAAGRRRQVLGMVRSDAREWPGRDP